MLENIDWEVVLAFFVAAVPLARFIVKRTPNVIDNRYLDFAVDLLDWLTVRNGTREEAELGKRAKQEGKRAK